MNDILLIRFSSLGDVVMTTAVIEALRRNMPEARIHVLTKVDYSGLFQTDDRVERVIAVQGDEAPLPIVKMTGRNSFDAVIDLHGSLRSITVA